MVLLVLKYILFFMTQKILDHEHDKQNNTMHLNFPLVSEISAQIMMHSPLLFIEQEESFCILMLYSFNSFQSHPWAFETPQIGINQSNYFSITEVTI